MPVGSVLFSIERAHGRRDVEHSPGRFPALCVGRLGALSLLHAWAVARLPRGACFATVSVVDYRTRITIDPGKRGGKPCVRGLRITVYDVLEYLASGMSEDEILRDFPDLTSEDIRACLAFAADRERRLFLVPAA